MSAVVVGYVPSPEGEAALKQGVVEARLRGVRLLVVNNTRGDALVDDRFVQGGPVQELQARLDELDVPTELRQPVRGGQATRRAGSSQRTAAGQSSQRIGRVGTRPRRSCDGRGPSRMGPGRNRPPPEHRGHDRWGGGPRGRGPPRGPALSRPDDGLQPALLRHPGVRGRRDHI